MKKVSVFNLSALIFVLAVSALALFYLRIDAVMLSYFCMASALIAGANVAFLRFTRNLAVAGNVAVFVFWATLGAIRWFNGSAAADGLMLLTWIWNAVLILLAVFLTGYKWGAAWACVVFLEGGFSIYLFKTGYGFVNLIPSEMFPQYALGFYLVGLLSVLLFAFLFEKERREAISMEAQKTQMLQESKKFIEEVLERSPVPTFVVDKKHRVVQWNKACTEISGVPAGEMIGKPVWEGFFLDDEGSLADKVLDDLEGVSENRPKDVVASESGSFAIKGGLPKLNGAEVVMKTAPLSNLEGLVSGAIQTVQPLGPVAKDFSSELPAFRVDLSGKISGWSEACGELFSYPRSQMLGASPLKLAAKPCRKGLKETLVGVLKGGPPKTMELECAAGGGKPLFVIASVYPLKAPSGRVRGCCVFNADITSLKLRAWESERRAMAYREKLKTALQEHQLLRKNISAFVRKQI